MIPRLHGLGRYVYYHYWGGLGDVLYLMLADECRYNILSEFEERDRAVVVVTSPNLNARELFDCHPNAHQIKVTFNPWEANTGPPAKTFLKPWMQHIPPMHHAMVRDRLVFHPTEKDQAVLDEIGDRPFIVVAPTAAGRPRCFPDWLTKKVIRIIQAHGALPVFIGASYKVHGFYPYKYKGSFHGEPERNESGIFSAINRLTVPGSIHTMSKAAGVISCYSSMCVGAYTVRQKQLIISNDQVMSHLATPGHRLGGIDKDPLTTITRFQDPCITKVINQYVREALA